jgi:hypothetical protein
LITDATFWLQPPEIREEQIPSLDPHCLVCGQSLEHQAFFWELYMGPQLDIGGMHLRCAYLHSVRVLSDLATSAQSEAANETDAASAYDEQDGIHVAYSPEFDSQSS